MKLQGLKGSLLDTFDYLNQNASEKDLPRDVETGRRYSKGESLYNYLAKSSKFSFGTPNWLRGTNKVRKILIVDEAQNMTPLVIKTAITRISEGSMIIILGDIKQIDDPYLSEMNNGLSYVSDKLNGEDFFRYINLKKSLRNKFNDRVDELL